MFYELHVAAIKSNESGNLFTSSEDRIFLLTVLLHCADISNPVKPANIADK